MRSYDQDRDFDNIGLVDATMKHIYIYMYIYIYIQWRNQTSNSGVA